jgi:hypothetical protein
MSMTREEFERFMLREGWTLEQQEMFRNFTPECDAETLGEQMKRPDGVIPVRITRRESLFENWRRHRAARC